MSESAPMGWTAALNAAVDARGRLCVGIDPHPDLLDAWGLGRDAEGLEAFCEICVEAFAGEAAVVKPQVGFFETYGSAGFAVLERTVSVLRAAGTLVIADAKRGDIGFTMDAYAAAWLGPNSPLSADAVTVSPYLGFGSLSGAVDTAVSHGRGVFVLARTSNSEGVDVQTAIVRSAPEDDRRTSVAQSIVDNAAASNAANGTASSSTVGLVIGATRGHGLELANFYGPILAPGLGAQGATVEDLVDIFGSDRKLLLPSASRSILRAGPGVGAIRDAAGKLRDDVENALA